MNDKIFTIRSKREEKFLRQPTQPVADINAAETTSLIKRMEEMMSINHGVGLAANQIGENKKILVVNFEGKYFVLINPEIIKKSKKIISMEEACLSVPEIVGLVKRNQKIVIKGYEQSGKTVKLKAKDVLARIFQHEIDHLNGILFVDKADKLYRIQIYAANKD